MILIFYISGKNCMAIELHNTFDALKTDDINQDQVPNQDQEQEEYPPLGYEQPRQPRGQPVRSSPRTSPSSTRFNLGQTPYITMKNARDNAYREEVAQHNTHIKTRFCKNMGNCSYGDKCTFAHSYEELHVNKCKFGSRCHHIITQHSGTTTHVINKYPDHKCRFIHPGETKNSAVQRFI